MCLQLSVIHDRDTQKQIDLSMIVVLAFGTTYATVFVGTICFNLANCIIVYMATIPDIVPTQQRGKSHLIFR